jgi:Ca2+-binding RTX toxin-like protein
MAAIDWTPDTKKNLYRFFAIAFDAAPGVTYMSELYKAVVEGNLTVKQIVNVWVTKPQFTSVYPDFLGVDGITAKLVETVIGSAATQQVKNDTAAEMAAAVKAGSSLGDVIFQSFTNLANPANLANPVWAAKYGNVAKLLDNQVKYAEYYTEVLLKGAEASPNPVELRAVIAGVTPTTAVDSASIAAVLNPAPVIETFGLAVNSPSVVEGDAGMKTLTFVLSLDKAPSSDIVVNYQVSSGTASAGSDYEPAAGAVKFLAGQTAASLSLTVIGDDVVESNETVVLSFTGERLSASVTATGTITNDDAAPVFVTAATASVAENAALSRAVFATDADSATVTYAIAGGADAAAFDLNATSGVLSFKSGPANFEAKADADGNNVYEVVVRATDGSGNATSQALSVTVTDVNEAPTAVVLGNAVASVAENTSTASRVKVADLSYTDDALGTNVPTLSGADASKFEIVGGALFLKAGTALDFEGQQAYAVTVTASDASVVGSTPVSASYALAVTNVNEAPTVTSSATGAVAENAPVATVIYSAAGADVDAGDALSFSLGGADASLLNIDSKGAVTLKAAANFEAKSSYAFTVTATDKGGLQSAAKAVTVSVSDVNEAPIVASGATGSVAENAPVSTVIYTATAADVDATDSASFTLGGADAGLLNISDKGEVTLKASANFEAKSSYNFTVTATDKGGLSSEAKAVSVSVGNVNEAPVLTSLATGSVSENAAVTTVVYTAVATDVDAGDVRSYSISGADADLLAINSASGEVTLKSSANFEAKSSYAFTVTATDKSGATDSKAVTVSVANVNEKPTAVGDSASTADNTAVIIDVLANDSDPDGSADTLSVASFTQGKFGSVSALDGKLVYSPNATFLNGTDSFTYIAKDAGGLQTDAVTVTVVVNTVNTAPSITAGQKFTVNENLAAGTAVDTVLYSDQEGNSAQNWQIVGGTGKDLFAINKFTGEVTTKAPFNFEGTSSYTLNVQTQDSSGLQSAVQVVNVNIGDVNEAPVISSSDKGEVEENAALATVIYTAKADDVDAGDKQTYSLKPGVGDVGMVSIDSASGAVTLKSSANFESKNSYSFTVVSTDVGGLTAEKAVTVSVKDMNEAPTVTSLGTATVAENALTSTVVYKATSFDVDAGDSATYSLGGTDAALLSIDKNTGEVTLKASANLEAKGTYSFTVTATDKGNLASDAKAVTLTVTNENEAPTFSSATAKASVAENALASTVIYTAKADDVDSGDQQTYTLKAGGDAAAFSIDGKTGELKLNASADYETKTSYSVTVVSTDKGGLTAEQAVTVDVTDVNEAPVVTSGAVGAVNENAATTTVVYTATATDVDAGDTRTFSLTGADAGLLDINKDTGVVTLKASANFEAKSTYTFNVIATDKGGLPSAAQAVTVTVGDQPDGPVANADTVVTFSGRTTVIDPVAGTYIDDKGASKTTGGQDTDEDAADVLTITNVTKPSQGGIVSIVGGKLEYTSALGFAGTDTFTYTITDKQGAASSSTVTVNVSSNTGGTSGNDMLFGTTAAENIDGLEGDDTIIGGGGADTLIGGEGNDRITFRDAVTQVLGGNGVDTLVVNRDAVAFEFDFSQTGKNNQVTGAVGGATVTAQVAGMENLDATLASNPVTVTNVAAATSSIITGSQADTVGLANAAGAITVQTLAGDDTVTTGVGTTATKWNIDGGSGNDTIDAFASLSTSAATLTGGTGDDTITGQAASNIVDAGDGNDVVTGGAAADTITGGAGNDTITANGGNNSVSAGDDNDTVTAGSGDDTIDGGTGNNDITTGDGANTVTAANGDNVVTGGAGADKITLGDGKNTITAADGNDTITVGNGANTINTGIGTNSVTAGNGANTVNGGTGDDTIVLGSGGNTVDANGGNDSVSTGSGVDAIDITDAGEATVSAGAGDDVITAGAAFNAATVVLDVQDSIDGGDGNDTLRVESIGSTDANFLNVKSVEVLTVTAGVAGTTLGANAQAGGIRTVNLAATNDTLDASAYTAALTVNLGNGVQTVDTGLANDTINGGSTVTDADDIDGNGGTSDVLNINAAIAGLTAANKITQIEVINVAEVVEVGVQVSQTAAVALNPAHAPDGGTVTVNGSGLIVDKLNFTAAGAAYKVSVDGGAASDTLSGGAGVDTLNGGGGSDTINDAPGADNINGGAGDDRILVNPAGNVLTSADTVNGGEGNDTLVADAGLDDTLLNSPYAGVTSIEVLELASAGATTLAARAEAAGIRTVTGHTANDNVNASAYTAALTVNGGTGDDTITGGTGNDSLNGGDGNDVLVGNAGNDSFTIGTGDDNVSGGADDDTLTVSGVELTTADSIAGGAGADKVVLNNTSGAVVAGVNLTNVTDVERYEFSANGDRLVGVDADANSITFEGGAVGTVTAVTVDGSAITDAADSLTVTLDGSVDQDFTFNIVGTSGNDVVRKLGSLPNNVTLSGGAGDDRIVVNGDILGANITFDGGANTDTIELSGATALEDADFTRITNVEALTASAAVTLAATLGEFADKAGIVSVNTTSNGSNLTLNAKFDNALSITLGANTDSINAGASTSALTVAANEGDLTSADTLVGGTGSTDVLNVTANAGNADITNVSGFETVTITGKDNVQITLDTFAAEVVNGAQTINATALDGNTLTVVGGTATAGLTVLGSKNGGDAVTTGAGNDTIALTGPGGSTVSAGDGNDTISTGDGDDLITAGNGNDQISTGFGVDTVNAGAGNDTITGAGPDAKTLNGDDGNDTINGASGDDTITGGNGNDSIALASGGSATVNLDSTNTGNDSISGFLAGLVAGGGDVIDLSGATAWTLAADTDGTLVGYQGFDVASATGDLNLTALNTTLNMVVFTGTEAQFLANIKGASTALNGEVIVGDGYDGYVLWADSANANVFKVYRVWDSNGTALVSAEATLVGTVTMGGNTTVKDFVPGNFG